MVFIELLRLHKLLFYQGKLLVNSIILKDSQRKQTLMKAGGAHAPETTTPYPVQPIPAVAWQRGRFGSVRVWKKTNRKPQSNQQKHSINTLQTSELFVCFERSKMANYYIILIHIKKLLNRIKAC